MKRPDSSKAKYAVYIRKSSEGEDRQAESLVRQFEDLSPIIEREGLEVVVEPFEETQSAFRIGRPVFAELVQKTMDGEIDAWLCWHINRLSRNPIDGGMVIYLMDEGHLKEIRTYSGVYRNTPSDKLQLQLVFGISKNDSEEKSVMVHSGLRHRYMRGYPSAYPPVGFKLGYAPGAGSDTRSLWEVDKERMPLVRKVFRRFLEGEDSLSTITKYARQIGLTTIGRRSHGGGYLAFQTIHRMLNNPVYAGFFTGKGEQYDLAKELPRVITREEHDRIALILGSRCTSRPSYGRVYAFSGLIRTPQGETLIVDPKYQLVCDCGHKFAYRSRQDCPSCHKKIHLLQKPQYRIYNYYFSVRARRGLRKWLPTIEEKKVRGLLADHVRQNLRFPPEVMKWTLQFIQELQDDALRDQQRESQRRAESVKELHAKRRRLLDLRIDGEITKEEYSEKLKELEPVEQEMNKPNYTLPEDWRKEAEKIGNLTEELLQLLRYGDARQINDAVKSIGISMVWDGTDLHFTHSQTLSKVMALFKQYTAGAGKGSALVEQRQTAKVRTVPHPGGE